MARRLTNLPETIIPVLLTLLRKLDFAVGSVIKRRQLLPFETDALLPVRVVRGGAKSAPDYSSAFENSKSALKKMAGRRGTGLNVKFAVDR